MSFKDSLSLHEPILLLLWLLILQLNQTLDIADLKEFLLNYTIWLDDLPLCMLLAVRILAYLLRTTGKSDDIMAMSLPISPLALKSGTISVNESTSSVSAAILEPAFMQRSIVKDADTFSVASFSSYSDLAYVNEPILLDSDPF